MHRIAQTESFIDAALENQLLNCIRNIHKSTPALYFEPKIFRQRFHSAELPPHPITVQKRLSGQKNAMTIT
jgi:hypothetical protein